MLKRGVLIALLALAACGEREVLLVGERLDPRGNPIPEETVNRTQPLALEAPRVNASWTHPGGSVTHQIAQPALPRSLAPVWSVQIGDGESRKYRITADPVIADGRIFTMDSRARVSAVSTGGQLLWSTDLTPSADRAGDVSGGGLAVADGRVYATSAAGVLNVLDAATGAVLWSQDFQSAAPGAPTVANGVVYVVTANSAGWALSAQTGRVLWQVFGATAVQGSTEAPSPTVAGPLVVFPLPSGQLVSAVASSGSQAWSASVAGERLGRAYGNVSDLTGAPVFAGNTIYAASQAGRIGAFDATTGRVLWRAEEGALGPLWLAGGSLFFVSDTNRLMRLDAATGETVWAQNLPYFTRERIRRRKAVYAHQGPVLAGGRLILVSDDGQLRQFDPASGALLSSQQLPDGAARNPVVADGTLYVVTENGRLHALR